MPAAAHTRWWRIGEVVLGVPLLVAGALQLAVPLRLPAGGWTLAFDLGGAALMAAGVAIIAMARRELARHGQPTDPGRPTRRLVTTGVFAISRNPLYLGALLFLAGLALLIGLTWMVVLLAPTVLACHYLLVAPEERYLITTFGDEYRGYAERVGRWLGRRGTGGR